MLVIFLKQLEILTTRRNSRRRRINFSSCIEMPDLEGFVCLFFFVHKFWVALFVDSSCYVCKFYCNHSLLLKCYISMTLNLHARVATVRNTEPNIPVFLFTGIQEALSQPNKHLLYCLVLESYIIFYPCIILMNTLQHPAVFPEKSVPITCENHYSPLLLVGMRHEGV